MPAILRYLQAPDHMAAFGHNMTIVLAYPGSIPMPQFNRIFTQPFSKYKVRGVGRPSAQVKIQGEGGRPTISQDTR